MKVVGLILAGGLSRRMGGGDKALRLLSGRTLIEHVIERLKPQVETLILNANGEPRRFARFGLPVVADSIRGYPGPLAGILAGLDWTADHRPDCEGIVSVASDAPFLPQDLVARLAEGLASSGKRLACAASAGRAHPVFAFWPGTLRSALRRAITEEGIRKVDLFTERHGILLVPFAGAPVDPFYNINRLEDLLAAEELAGRLAG